MDRCYFTVYVGVWGCIYLLFIFWEDIRLGKFVKELTYRRV